MKKRIINTQIKNILNLELNSKITEQFITTITVDSATSESTHELLTYVLNRK